MGNRFDDVQILKAIELGDKYSLAKIPVNSFTIHSIAIDIGFGSSNTAVVATKFLKEESRLELSLVKNGSMEIRRPLLI